MPIVEPSRSADAAGVSRARVDCRRPSRPSGIGECPDRSLASPQVDQASPCDLRPLQTESAVARKSLAQNVAVAQSGSYQSRQTESCRRPPHTRSRLWRRSSSGWEAGAALSRFDSDGELGGPNSEVEFLHGYARSTRANTNDTAGMSSSSGNTDRSSLIFFLTSSTTYPDDTPSGKHRWVRSAVGVEKVGTNQLISMKSIWQCEVFSSIV